MQESRTAPIALLMLSGHLRMQTGRLLPSNDFYPALAQPNVSLVTEKIIELRPDAVVTADGTEDAVDTVIFATGFHVTDNPMFGKITGADAEGRNLTLWPGFTFDFRRRTRTFRTDDFVFSADG